MKLFHRNKVNAFVVFAVTVCLIGCSENNLTIESLSVFPNGIFSLNKKESNDTLKFQREVYDKRVRGLYNITWEFRNDSLFQKRPNGRDYFFGRDRSSYKFESDTLTLTYNYRNGRKPANAKTSDNVEIYKVIHQNEDGFWLVMLSKKKFHNFLPIEDFEGERIQSDIQLR